MKKGLILLIISALLIVTLTIISYTLLSNVKDLEQELSEARYVIEDKIIGTAILEKKLIESKDNNRIYQEALKEANTKLSYEEAMSYNQKVYKSIQDTTRWNYSNLLLEQTDLLSRYDMSDSFIVYGSDSNAESVIRHYYLPIDQSATVEGKLNAIANSVSKYKFAECPIELKGFETIEGKNIAIINISEPEDLDHAFSTYYFMGSSMGSITTDILVESFLQREVALDDWIDGVHFEYKGKRDWITDHDPSLCRYTYFRDGTKLEDN